MKGKEGKKNRRRGGGEGGREEERRGGREDWPLSDLQIQDFPEENIGPSNQNLKKKRAGPPWWCSG